MEDFTPNTQIHANSLRAFSILFFLVSFSVFSQGNLSTSSKKSLKLYEKADKKYKERDFESAISYLEESVIVDANFFEAYIRMGSLYNTLGKLDSVYSKFSSYINTAPDPISSVVEKMAFMSFDRGEYQRSLTYLNQFLEKVPEKGGDNEIALLKTSLDFAQEQLKNPMNIEILELPKEINKYQLQYLPTITVDGSTMIYTKRDIFSSDEDIVVSYKKDGVWQPSQSISPKINTPLNEGACTISADGRTMIFTSCDRRDAFGSCDLFISKKVGKNWSAPKNLGKAVNSKYWESQPSLSADGKTLYFTSNRPGGYGGRDIWVTKSIDDVWQKPINLGSQVNSFKDETTPSIHFNGVSLYFSSNSYSGMGGFDLFMTTKKDSTWSSPKNLGYPINTFRDEVALLVSGDGQSGYFAKEELKNREILDSRIVGLSLPLELQPPSTSYLIGKVVDKETKKPLKASIEVIDIDSGVKLYNSNSDSLTGEYYMVLPINKNLAGYVKKPGYLYSNFHFETNTESIAKDTILVELSKIEEGQTLILKNIYFETDSYDLDERSVSELESVVQLLQENLGIHIEIGGHTDDIGTKDYNQALSEKRAIAVYQEVLKAGVDKRRMVYKGFGDATPLKPNDTEVNRQSNRRIEFRVLRLN